MPFQYPSDKHLLSLSMLNMKCLFHRPTLPYFVSFRDMLNNDLWFCYSLVALLSPICNFQGNTLNLYLFYPVSNCLHTHLTSPNYRMIRSFSTIHHRRLFPFRHSIYKICPLNCCTYFFISNQILYNLVCLFPCFVLRAISISLVKHPHDFVLPFCSTFPDTTFSFPQSHLHFQAVLPCKLGTPRTTMSLTNRIPVKSFFFPISAAFQKPYKAFEPFDFFSQNFIFSP